MRRDMNFFSEFSLKKKTQDDGSTILVKTLIGIVATLVVVTLLYTGINILYCSIMIKNTEAKINTPEVQQQLQESDQVTSKKEILDQYNKGLSQVVNSVASRDIVNTTLINQICSALPTEVQITNINVDHSAIVMRGTSTKREPIAEFENNLKNKVDRIDTCELSSVAGDQTLTFELKCVLKDVE